MSSPRTTKSFDQSGAALRTKSPDAELRGLIKEEALIKGRIVEYQGRIEDTRLARPGQAEQDLALPCGGAARKAASAPFDCLSTINHALCVPKGIRWLRARTDSSKGILSCGG